MFLATFRRSSEYAKIIRCGRSARWSTKYSRNCRLSSTRCIPKWSSVDSTGAVAARSAVADAVLVRSERLLIEEIDYNILFRWFVGLNFGRCSVGCHGVHQEPRPFAGGRSGQGLSGAGGGASPRAGLGLDEHSHGGRSVLKLGPAPRVFSARTSRVRRRRMIPEIPR